MQADLRENESQNDVVPVAVHGTEIQVFLTTGRRAVSERMPYVLAVSISPDGAKCAIVGVQDRSTVSFLDVDSGSVTGGLKISPHVWDGAISNQGAIAVTLDEGWGESAREGPLVVFQPGSDGPIRVAAAGRSPSFPSDGGELVYEDNGRIIVHSISSKTGRAIASGMDPSVSPDGLRIAFRSADGYFHVVDRFGKQDKRLVRSDGIVGRLSWDPSSEYLLYLRGLLGVWEAPLDIARLEEMKKVIAIRCRDGRAGVLGGVPGYTSPADFAWVKSRALRLRAADVR